MHAGEEEQEGQEYVPQTVINSSSTSRAVVTLHI